MKFPVNKNFISLFRKIKTNTISKGVLARQVTQGLSNVIYLPADRIQYCRADNFLEYGIL